MSGKRIVNAYKTVNKDQAYALKEAVKIVKETLPPNLTKQLMLQSTSVLIRNMPTRWFAAFAPCRMVRAKSTRCRFCSR